MIPSTSYLPVPIDLITDSSHIPKKQKENNLGDSNPVLLISGQTSRLYQFEWAIRAIDELRDHHDLMLLICTYGSIIDSSYFNEITDLVATRPYVKLLHNTPFLEFLKIQSKALIFLRPTKTDSCGIALWDSSHLGCRLVASNVCERPPGTYLHAPDDYDGFIKQITTVLENRSIPSITAPRPKAVLPQSFCEAYGT